MLLTMFEGAYSSQAVLSWSVISFPPLPHFCGLVRRFIFLPYYLSQHSQHIPSFQQPKGADAIYSILL